MPRSFRRTVLAAASSLVLVGACQSSVVPARSTDASSRAGVICSVQNEGTGTTYDALQPGVDASSEGDTLLVRGTCIGKTSIRHRTLRLKGVPTTEQPIPTLDGGGVRGVLTLKGAHVTIRDLTITNGRARIGGGVLMATSRIDGTIEARPRLTLNGSTSIEQNTATWWGGGGIYNEGGTLTLNDSASVTGNTVVGGGIFSEGGDTVSEGGGIYNDGTLTLNDSASVTANTALTGGGIYVDYGKALHLNDASSVSGNRADTGGGIYNHHFMTLSDAASVTRNTATGSGGGIYNPEYGRIYVCSDRVAISPNDPDDPPRARHDCPWL